MVCNKQHMEVKMVVQVIGQNFDVGESLTERVKSVLESKMEKYNQKLISANVIFTQAPHKKVSSSIKIQLKGLDLFAKSEEDDAYLAFNSAVDDIETQLVKNLEKFKSHK